MTHRDLGDVLEFIDFLHGTESRLTTIHFIPTFSLIPVTFDSRSIVHYELSEDF